MRLKGLQKKSGIRSEKNSKNSVRRTWFYQFIVHIGERNFNYFNVGIASHPKQVHYVNICNQHCRKSRILVLEYTMNFSSSVES